MKYRIMEKNDRIGIVCCSNGRKKKTEREINSLKNVLQHLGLVPVFSPFLYETESVESVNARKRAEILMDFYKDPSIRGIFDISGGDIANMILPYLDFRVISCSGKELWGYSDLTTVLNAIYGKTGKTSVLYQIRNLVSDNGFVQEKEFAKTVFGGRTDLFSFPYTFCQEKKMEGVIVGGNIRCFLKLAGTPYFPDLTDKILLLEARGGSEGQILTYFAQLSQMGAFLDIRGVLLGTFTELESRGKGPSAFELLQGFLPEGMPVVKTKQVGHGSDSKAVRIGQYYTFYEKEMKNVIF
ncbi:MAG: LD-carboxypeptidase [Lachnospiraceae bacterium]|nr:LD-carboxypeptidase [Lachnospiraceae bacterium]MDY5497760.1 LD-carboxypeptidase [Anaerobutyricum sp.]